MPSSSDIVDAIWERFRDEHKKLDVREQNLAKERRELTALDGKSYPDLFFHTHD
jgi:hypothetical protein